MIKYKFQKIKNIYHLGQAVLANFVYGFLGQKIKIIGVTGTNGKTTTVWMIGKILEEAGYRVAINSTINFQIGTKKWVNKTKFTTLSSFAVQKFIQEAVREKCDYLVLETSSHSLDQFRVWGIPYAVAVMTNVTREHLDYHQTMEEYRKAKLKLFKKVETIVVNLDMENPEYYLNCNAKEKYGYSIKSTNKTQDIKHKFEKIIAKDIELGINYSKYQILNTKYQIHLLGRFNIENALAATCVGLSQGVDLEIIRKALEKIQGIPGRMERVPNDKGLNIIIDYAVTPDSLKKFYQLIREINKEDKKIIAVFGACGERDRGKRPIMGEIVAKYADYIILTNEDPHREDPQRIINEVFQGVSLCHFERSEAKLKNLIESLNKTRNDIFCFTENVNCWRILDRREAIKKALKLAQPGDFIVITGKGAEETISIGKEKIPWKEKEVVIEELDKIKISLN